jgi:hypothetical protein
MGLVSVLSATLFPQDAWGSAPTFAGQMHGVIALLAILYMMLIGIWMSRAEGFPRFQTDSFINVGAVVLSAGFFVANRGVRSWAWPKESRDSLASNGRLFLLCGSLRAKSMQRLVR